MLEDTAGYKLVGLFDLRLDSSIWGERIGAVLTHASNAISTRSLCSMTVIEILTEGLHRDHGVSRLIWLVSLRDASWAASLARSSFRFGCGRLGSGGSHC